MLINSSTVKLSNNCISFLLFQIFLQRYELLKTYCYFFFRNKWIPEMWWALFLLATRKLSLSRCDNDFIHTIGCCLIIPLSCKLFPLLLFICSERPCMC